jgi:hypothetical protein
MTEFNFMAAKPATNDRAWQWVESAERGDYGKLQD